MSDELTTTEHSPLAPVSTGDAAPDGRAAVVVKLPGDLTMLAVLFGLLSWFGVAPQVLPTLFGFFSLLLVWRATEPNPDRAPGGISYRRAVRLLLPFLGLAALPAGWWAPLPTLTQSALAGLGLLLAPFFTLLIGFCEQLARPGTGLQRRLRWAKRGSLAPVAAGALFLAVTASTGVDYLYGPAAALGGGLVFLGIGSVLYSARLVGRLSGRKAEYRAMIRLKRRLQDAGLTVDAIPGEEGPVEPFATTRQLEVTEDRGLLQTAFSHESMRESWERELREGEADARRRLDPLPSFCVRLGHLLVTVRARGEWLADHLEIQTVAEDLAAWEGALGLYVIGSGAPAPPGEPIALDDPILNNNLHVRGADAARVRRLLSGLHAPLLAVLHAYPGSTLAGGRITLRLPLSDEDAGMEQIDRVVALAQALDARQREGLSEG